MKPVKELRIEWAPASRKPALRALLAEFAAAIGEPAPDAEGFARITRALDDGRIAFALASDGADPIGMCSLTAGFSTYGAAPFGLVDDPCVDPTRRGGGVARALLEAVTAEARSRGCRSLLIGCSDGDVGMWKHFGFRKIGNLMATDLPGS